MTAGLALGGCAALEPGAGFPVARPAALDPDEPVAIIGDLQMTSWLVRAARRREHNREAQARLVADLTANAERLAAVAIAGDLVFNARSRRDWRHFDALMGPLAARVPVLPALGNHDYACWFVEFCRHGAVPGNVRLRFPWIGAGEAWLVPYGDVALVFLDSETRVVEQAAWLAERMPDLERRFRALVAIVHKPPYSHSAERGETTSEAVRDHVLPVLAAVSLPRLVVSGHAHGYEHLVVAGEHYVVTAGGGGPRSRLRAARPGDVYRGPDCARDIEGRVLRPFNYVLLERGAAGLEVRVRGFCDGDEPVAELERFTVGVPDQPAVAAARGFAGAASTE